MQVLLVSYVGLRANAPYARNWRYFLRQKTLGILFVLAAAVLFGINGSLSRLLFDSGVTPLTLVEFRMIVGSLCLFGFLLTQPRQAWRLPRRSQGWLVAFGLVIALVTYTYFVAISRVNIALVLVIQFTGPVWMVTAVALWRRRMPSWQVLGALLLTICGVVLVTGLLEHSLGSLDVIGLLFSFFALITFIAYLVLGRKVGGQLHPIASTAYGAGVAGVFWLIVQPPWSIPASTWNPHIIILIVLVGIIGMAIPFSLEIAALRRLDATRAGIAAMFELPASALIAFFWLSQRLDFWQILGCALVLAGITIVQLEKPGKQKKSEQSSEQHESEPPLQVVE
jgi:drug/metabolite transporter (DMT)-like permease